MYGMLIIRIKTFLQLCQRTTNNNANPNLKITLMTRRGTTNDKTTNRPPSIPVKPWCPQVTGPRHHDRQTTDRQTNLLYVLTFSLCTSVVSLLLIFLVGKVDELTAPWNSLNSIMWIVFNCFRSLDSFWIVKKMSDMFSNDFKCFRSFRMISNVSEIFKWFQMFQKLSNAVEIMPLTWLQGLLQGKKPHDVSLLQPICNVSNCVCMCMLGLGLGL